MKYKLILIIVMFLLVPLLVFADTLLITNIASDNYVKENEPNTPIPQGTIISAYSGTGTGDIYMKGRFVWGR